MKVINALGTISDFWKHFSKRRKKQIIFLFVITVASGLSEAVSIGLVVPFLAVMAAPETLSTNSIAHSWVSIFEKVNCILGLGPVKAQPDTRNFIHLFALLFIAAALFTGTIRLALLWLSTRIAGAIGTDLGLEAFRRTLYQPYSVHVSRNSSNLISSMTSKISMTTRTFNSWLTLISSIVMIIFILGTLLLVSYKITVFVGGVIGVAYSLSALVSNQKLVANSLVLSREHNLMVKFLQEGLGAIRDILLDGTQSFYSKLYLKSDRLYRRAYAKINIIGNSPRYIMETVGMTIFAVLALVLSKEPDGLALALPTLGALALGVQRLLPCLQQGYQAWSTILGYQESNQEVATLLNQPLPRWASQPQPPPLCFTNKIRFDNVKFNYFEKGPCVLGGISFTINKGSRIGFVGATGSGKSTCMDLLMGLLEPTEGRILVDGAPLGHEKLRAWQKNIAHVPQAIYLSDSTLAENIAFGVPVEKIDMARVRAAARQAQIADFIESSPQGYQALVGERGIRLSGGQRQRIGIARALYKQAQVLVFDEATSALDHETEDAVMRSINSLSSDLTILVVSHRMRSLRNCSHVLCLRDTKAKMIPSEKLLQTPSA